jgi:hypothetical protein
MRRYRVSKNSGNIFMWLFILFVYILAIGIYILLDNLGLLGGTG